MSHILEFLDLVDTPSTFSGFPNRPVKVNAGATALEFGSVAAEYSSLDTSNFDGIFDSSVTNVQLMADQLDDGLYLVASFFNGIIAETFNALVTESGGTVTLNLEAAPSGGDLNIRFSDGWYTLDCTPTATINLTAGTDSAPTTNYVYVLQSTKALTKSTSGWPSAEHAKVAFLLVPSATQVSSDGCYINQNWNDHVTGTDDQGHLTHMTEAIRLTMGGATWNSGVAGNASGSEYLEITGTSPSTVYFKSTSGVSYQMHKHTIPAIDTSAGDDCHVVNWNGTPYYQITDFASITADANGGSLSNKYFNLVMWGVANKTGEYAPLMCNLPTGAYTTLTGAENDIDSHDVTTIPREFIQESTTGFLVCRLTCSQTPTGTWTLHSTTDLRGVPAGASAGAGVSGAALTEFPDNQFTIFNVTDNTKVVDFDLSTLTTGNTRTITPADADMTLLSTTQYTDLTDGGVTALHKHNISALEGVTADGPATGDVLVYTGSSYEDETLSYGLISGIDGTTDVAGGELEELTDGSTTTLHDHDVTGLTNWLGPYLPLTAGSGSPLTGNLYLDNTISPTIYLREAGSTTSYGFFSNTSVSTSTLAHAANTGTAYLQLEPRASDGTSAAVLQLIRNTNTTDGSTGVYIYKGDGTSTVNYQFLSKGDCQFNKDSGNATFFGNVFLDKTADPTIFFREGGDTDDYGTIFHIGNNANFPAFKLRSYGASGAAPSFHFDCMPADGTSNGYINMHRSTNTTGGVGLLIYKGDNTTTQAHQFFGSGSAFLDVQGTGTVNVGNNLDVGGHVFVDKTVDPSIQLREGGSTTSLTKMVDDGWLGKLRKIGTGTVALWIDADSTGGTGDASIQLFRETNTTGTVKLSIHEGDGTSSVQHSMDAGSGVANFSQQGGSLQEAGNDVLTEGAAEFSALTEKSSPVSGDWLIIEDSAASNAKKKLQLSNLPAGAPSIPLRADDNSDSSFRRYIGVDSDTVNISSDMLFWRPFGASAPENAQHYNFKLKFSFMKYNPTTAHQDQVAELVICADVTGTGTWHSSSEATLIGAIDGVTLEQVRLYTDPSGYLGVMIGDLTDSSSNIAWSLDVEVSLGSANEWTVGSDYVYVSSLTSYTLSDTVTVRQVFSDHPGQFVNQLTLTNPAASDNFVFEDASDSNEKKRANLQSIHRFIDNSNYISIEVSNDSGSAMAKGDLCYISGDSSGVPQVTLADADAEASASKMLVLIQDSINNGSDGTAILLGVQNGFTSLTAGGICYVSTTAGDITQTAPSGSGDIVRIVGHAISTTEIFFNPSVDYAEV